MKLHLVNSYGSYAMERHVAPLRNLEGYEISESREPRDDVDLNYFIPHHGLADNKPPGKSVMLYTHTNTNAVALTRSAIKNADAAVCLSWEGVRELESLGWRNKPVVVAYAPVDGFMPSKISVLVVGSEQPNGRKHSSLLMDLAWKMDLSPFHFIIIGQGWNAKALANAGVSLQYAESGLSSEQMVNLYNAADLVLCTGYVEGGPLPLAEALACGKRVLSPKFGFASEFLDDDDIYDTLEDLIQKLNTFVQEKAARVDTVGLCNTQYYTTVHKNVFADILNSVVTDRYQHVHRIVRNAKARRILEVGTWRGDRALAMISAAREIYGEDVVYYGYDLWEELTPELLKKEFSKQPPSSSTVYKRLASTGASVVLHKGNTKSSLAKFRSDKDELFDFIYIDGGHSWETIDSDWKHLQKFAHPNTVFLFDDYYYNKPEEVYGIGCQKLVDNLGKEWRVEKLGLIESWPQPWGNLQIGMVRVTHA